jgi:hypothetical protein
MQQQLKKKTEFRLELQKAIKCCHLNLTLGILITSLRDRSPDITQQCINVNAK